MSKYYFTEEDDENCYSLYGIKKSMKIRGISKMKVFEARRLIGTGYFYCSIKDTIGKVSESFCGRTCKYYEPRNGKNGRCRFSSFLYIKTDKSKIIKLK